MTGVNFKSVEDFRNIILNSWKMQMPSANLSADGQIYMDATALAEALFSVQMDAFLLAEEAFIPYATGDRLTNLGLERGMPRKSASIAIGSVTFGRSQLANVNYIIPAGTEVGTQPDVNGISWNYITKETVTIYGTLTDPTGFTGLTSTSGGSLPANNDFYYVVTAVDGNGNETLPSAEILVTTGVSATNSNQLSWNAVTNAAAYNIYLGYTPGTETLLATVLGTLYTHTSSGPDGVTPVPTGNTTGALTTTVDVEAVESGVGGNVPAGAVSVLIDSPVGVETVTNPFPMNGGANEESDTEYRDRMQEAFISGSIQSKTTKGGYENTARSVSGVGTAVVDDYNVGAYRNEFDLYITSADTQTGIPTAELIAEVQAVVNSDENRSPNDIITVKSPTPITVDVNVIINEFDTNYAIGQLIQTATNNIREYINSRASGETVYVVDIENAVHDTIGILDFTVVTPSNNQLVATASKAVAGTITITE